MLAYVRALPILHVDERAVTALEYALIAGVLVTTIILGFNVFASDLSNKFNTIASGMG